MKLLFTHEQHVVEHQGCYYNPTGLINYEGMCNYLHTIRRGVVVLRCARADTVDPGWPRVDGPGVEVHPIPEFGRLGQFLRAFPATIRGISQAIDRTDRYVVRMPGPAGALVALMLLLRGRRYGVEVAGHYTDLLETLIAERRLGPTWMRSLINRLVGFIIRRAAAVGYRNHYLRRLYPTFRREREFIFSGAQLNSDVIAPPREAEAFARRPFRIVSIGRVSAAKGYSTLVQAFARVRAQTSVPMELEIVGDGDEMPRIRRDVHELGLEGAVSLPGRIPWGPALFERLDRAHLFVLPSLQDAMPRSLIEAIAHGMPAVSTRCGGIPEILDEPDLVPPGDVEALAAKIASLVGNVQLLATMAKRNFQRSKHHWPEALDRAKRGFWESVVRHAR